MKKNLIRLIVPLCLASLAAADDMPQRFVKPPAGARPWVYWFPLSGNLTKQGITADFEAMARVGIGGVLYMETDQGAPKGAADFAGPLWMDLFSHACREAKRLGLQINMNNDAGWCGSGGPWIKPEMSMQKVVWTEAVVTHAEGAVPTVALPRPQAVKEFYQDIVVLAMPAPSVDARIPDIGGKASFATKQFPPLAADFPTAAEGSVIPRDQILDVTKHFSSDGKLTWNPPSGKWLVIRFGHTTTGKDNHPAPESGRGLECDKFSKQAATLHFNNLMGKLIERNKALTGEDKALVCTHIDSWEVGSQNWTPLMREEFQKRRGYDILGMLPVYTGRIVGSTEISERFLWDLRQTVSDLVVENYAGTFHKLAKQHGIRLSIEAYDAEPADDMAYAGQCDEPMGEFWSWTRFGAAYSCTEMASAAHTYGKRILGAEAFTANNAERWLGHPANIKDIGDWAFCEGVNRFVFHRYAAQPWLHQSPGMSMGPWGLHYERTQTWWEQSKAWHQYLARCQYLLQKGQFVADIAYLAPEGAPRRFATPPEAMSAPYIRGGYDFDGCSAEVVMTRMRVKDGRIVLPDGMSYRALVLPSVQTMTPALLAKIKQLADAGAMVVGPANPPSKAPSLADLGAGDDKVRKLAAELWSSGKVLTGKTAQQYLAERGVPADFTSSPMLRHIHRKIDGADVYFVANPKAQELDAVAGFRVKGMQPELWWPDSGRMESLASYEERDGMTRVPLHLEPRGSVFVVFRKSVSKTAPVVALHHNGELKWSFDKQTQADQAEVVISKAIYGVPNDPVKTRNVTKKLQQILDAGERDVLVSRMADKDDPAYGVVKTLTVDYSIAGKTFSLSATDPESVTFSASMASVGGGQVAGLNRESNGGMILSVSQAGRYDLKMGDGKQKSVNVAALPATQEINGPWQVRFDPAVGGPGDVTFAKLEDWSKRPEDGIRYYSGTANYKTTFEWDGVTTSGPAKWILDLGAVEVMAEIKLNGKDLGIAWKPPYQVDITSALKKGHNQLEVHVVNLWINRQIGDEHLPEDCDRNANGTLKSWPDWVQRDQKSPTGRYSFSSWKLWKKSDKLSPSGLIGPVRVRPVVQVAVP